MTPAEIKARNLSLGTLLHLLGQPEEAIPAMVLGRELEHRLIVASKICERLDDSLFYARMYRDTSEDGRARREEMIDDAVDLISIFRNGGIYP